MKPDIVFVTTKVTVQSELKKTVRTAGSAVVILNSTRWKLMAEQEEIGKKLDRVVDEQPGVTEKTSVGGGPNEKAFFRI